MADAGEALDLYLRKGRAAPEDYQVRGIIYHKLGQYLEAIEAYGRSLALQPNVNTFSHRGWAYLQLEAPRLALADFETALRLQEGHPEALCGRALARARLGDLRGAVADAETVRHQSAPTKELLLNAARIYGRAAGALETGSSPAARSAREVARYRERGIELLRMVLEKVPAEERPAFLRDNIRKDPELVPLRRSSAMVELNRRYAP